ncbi:MULTISPECIES: restriction endonuclease subunit S [Paraburkholderia]|uniref:restriction endonuclease subunit S n=1 Tax=Paraburkholderia TaxID=1822464 RepID=UPI00037E972F|nr:MULTISPECIES: restriction endonuclease subunit S [Paraburkholderia]MDH6150497.1 type I restriction enzyme S subunit [Paraburkholderia sp. WSM4179]
MTQSPAAWTTAKLSEIATVVRGITFPGSVKESSHTATNVCCLRTSNIQREVEWQDVYFVPKSYVKRQDQYVQRGDVLMSMANSYELVGKVAVAKDVSHATAFGAFLAAIRPTAAVNGQYLFHLLRTRKVQSELRQGSSQTTNIANISVTTLGTIQVPVAPLPEQKRIADKLDAVLARVDACQERLDRVPTILKRFRQSVLAAAFSGRLTKDWRGGAESDDAHQSPVYRYTTFGEVGKVSGGITKNAKRTAHTLKKAYLRVANVYENELRLDDVAEIGLTNAEYEKTRLRAGDLLIVEGNGSLSQIGRAALWNNEIEDCVHQNHIIKWRASEAVAPAFALYYLMSQEGRGNIIDVASSTTGLHTLSTSKISALPLPLPPTAEQELIVRRVAALFDFADAMEARLAAASNAIERLTPALLAKAFRGELAPQDPTDEPASELMKRLTEQRSGAGEAVKRKRTKGATQTVSSEPESLVVS